MQRENASICDVGDWEFVAPPALDEPDREAGRVVVDPRGWPTASGWLEDEP
jgi:hypothetical protein